MFLDHFNTYIPLLPIIAVKIMGKKKIFNDPIYGLISYPYDILYDLIDHPYFQRLRRISQTGMAHYVYPGAHHTRFQHALGALHLMTKAVTVLREKGVEISEQEREAVCIAILLHDIGHGPYSHALERNILDFHHEQLSLLYMEVLNETFEGRLSLAISIFKGAYHKAYLHELVSSQLDMDRMDYLSRDSYFTGVAEGGIGYDRLIKMLNVSDGHIVVEEKGIYSVEKFLMARRLMYWQVYLHKTALGVEQMLIAAMKRAKKLLNIGIDIECSNALKKLLKYEKNINNNKLTNNELLAIFSQLDDVDVLDLVKRNVEHADYILSYICQSLIKRQLFKVYLCLVKPQTSELAEIKNRVRKLLDIDKQTVNDLVITGFENNQLYNAKNDEIRILQKSGVVVPFSKFSDMKFDLETTGKYYVCHPSYN